MKFDENIKSFVDNKENTLLGICLGMQLLTTFGYESKKRRGSKFNKRRI